MPVMTATVSLPGRGVETLDLTQEPSFSRGEQGGYRDATVVANVPDWLRVHLREASITLFGPNRVAYFGVVRGIQGNTLTCVGLQDRLDKLPRGCVYRASGASGWQDMTSSHHDPSIGGGVDESDRLEAVFESGQAYDSGRYRNWVFHFPEPVSSVTMALTTAGLVTNTEVRYYYAQNYSTASWPLWGTRSSNTTATDTISASNITSIRIAIRSTVDTSTLAATITVNPTVYGTSVTTASAANIASHILGRCTSVIPLADVDSSLTTVIDDLSFLDPSTSEMAKLAELRKYGDWRFRIEPRLSSNVYVPCGVFGPRPTTVRYSLTEGPGVECDIGETSDPLCSVVRVLYKDVRGRTRFVDVTDTDTSHYLVAAGVTVYHTITVDTTSLTLATAAGQRYLIDAGRDQVQGTVTLTGAPNGIPACEYAEGELVQLTTRDRVVTGRITAIECDGPFSARLTLDNTPQFDELLFRMNRAHSKYAMRRA